MKPARVNVAATTPVRASRIGSAEPRDHVRAGGPTPAELGTVVVASSGPTASVLLGGAQAADPVACATEVLANLQSLAAAVAAWVPVPNDGGASLKAVFAAWFAGLQPMGDLKARVEGPVPVPP